MSYNNLKIEAYSTGTTILPDFSELKNIQDVRFSTGYPGGLYLDASFKIPRNVVQQWVLKGAQRVVIRNGIEICYEGYVTELSRVLEEDSEYIEVPLIGAWAKIAMARRWRKHWANDSLDERTWVWQTGASGAEIMTVDRTNRIRFTPKSEAFAEDDLGSVKYTMPVGEVIRQIHYDYAFNDNAADQDWVLEFYDATNGAQTIYSSASGAGPVTDTDQEYELGTAVNAIVIRFRSDAAGQTPVSDGTYYGEVSNLVVFGGEAVDNDVTLTQIATDIVSQFSAVINSSTAFLDTITQTSYSTEYAGRAALGVDGIVPFVMDDFPTIADILAEMASYGDDSFNSWAYGFIHSENVASPDGKPILFVEQQPALTSYDYEISYNDNNVIAPLALSENYDELENWIVVQYVDENGWTQYITPDTDANLKDTTSITDYGQRDGILSVGDATATMATNYGRRYLAQRKDPQWRATSPVKVRGYIHKSDGSILPASQIRAGKRLRIKNYLNDLSGTGLTLLITQTSYDDNEEICSMSFGRDDMFHYPEFSHPRITPEDAPIGESGGGGGGKGGRPAAPWVRAKQLGYIKNFKDWFKLSAAEKRRLKDLMGY